MGTRTIALQPGVNLELTPSLNTAAFQASNLIRFAPSGLPEKLGGWTKFYPNAFSSIIREFHAWDALNEVSYLAVGAQSELAVIANGVLSDITPLTVSDSVPVNMSTVAGSPTVTVIDATVATSPQYSVLIETPISVGGLILLGFYATAPFSSTGYTITAASNATSTVNNGGTVPSFTTTAGNSTVSVYLPNNGYSVGESFPVFVPTTVGGLTLSGFYQISAITNPNRFVIPTTAAATSNDVKFMNNGDALYVYYTGTVPQVSGTGYGVGGYGVGGYGVGSPYTPTPGTPITTTDWSLDNFGGYLLACPLNGPIFIWNPQSGVNVATPIIQAPSINTGMFVAMPAEIIVAYGSSVEGLQDPLLINWCDAGNFTQWTAAVTNQAGSDRLPRGSRIVAGMQGPLLAMIWTDLSLWTMSYIGQPDVWSFSEVATGCGLIGKHAAVTLGTSVYWMSQKQFFGIPAGGGVTPIPCSVWDFIFQNLDLANVANIRAAANSQFGEVGWFFPIVGGSGENTAYVKFTPAFSCWDFGYLGRSAWIDQSIFGPPIGADPGLRYIYQHETSPDADGVAMLPSITTGYFALEDGQDVQTINQVYMDMKWRYYDTTTTASIQLAFTYAPYPTGAIYISGPFTVTSVGPQFVNPRFRARLTSMTISSADLGTWWRWGGPRIRSAYDGRL